MNLKLKNKIKYRNKQKPCDNGTEQPPVQKCANSHLVWIMRRLTKQPSFQDAPSDSPQEAQVWGGGVLTGLKNHLLDLRAALGPMMTPA